MQYFSLAKKSRVKIMVEFTCALRYCEKDVSSKKKFFNPIVPSVHFSGHVNYEETSNISKSAYAFDLKFSPNLPSTKWLVLKYYSGGTYHFMFQNLEKTEKLRCFHF